ncbi:MAG: site-2 protease family protein [Treponema sp.]|nr:site-2 protease family protein [Treponema sp.]
MLIFRILLGLFGLGVVVFVHELGHFIAARLMGIKVEAFSIGWGKAILKKKIGEVEYRLGAFPIGGYCKMKGQSDFDMSGGKNNHGSSAEPAEKGSFFAAHPFRRIVACAGGPLFNLLFAVLVLSVIWGAGFEVNTLSNRIILVSDIQPGTVNPADDAGLQTGDRIVNIRGRETETFNDIQGIISVHPEEELPIQVQRNGETLDLTVRPALDKSTGAGRIGIFFWTDPIIEQVAEGSAAEIAGLKSGDTILSVNGEALPHTMALAAILEERPSVLEVSYLREGVTSTATLLPIFAADGAPANLGIAWQAVRYENPRLSPPVAVARGAVETWRIFVISVRSLSLLFRGVDLTKAVSGPIRITYMVGDVAATGFTHSFIAGLSSMVNFLALISIALCIMNLLPLPVLDGGMILLFLVEAIRKKPPHPRFVSAFQMVGVVLIAGLMIFAIFGDILYLANR